MSLDFITEPARHVPVIHRTDVLVLGPGPGGLHTRVGCCLRGCAGLHG